MKNKILMFFLMAVALSFTAFEADDFKDIGQIMTKICEIIESCYDTKEEGVMSPGIKSVTYRYEKNETIADVNNTLGDKHEQNL